MPRPDTSTASRRTAVGIEDSIRSDLLETGVLIAPDGRELARCQGQPDQVGLSHGELRRAKDATFTHNHPGGTSFSLDDVLIASKHNMREVRVVTRTHRHGIEKPHSRLMIPLRAQFASEYKRARAATEDDCRKGLLAPVDVPPEALHRTWDRLGRSLGFNYWRERT